MATGKKRAGRTNPGGMTYAEWVEAVQPIVDDPADPVPRAVLGLVTGAMMKAAWAAGEKPAYFAARIRDLT